MTARDVSLDVVARAFADAIARVCGERLGGEATAAPSDLPADRGWLLTVPVSGAAEGRIAFWFDRASAAALARAASGAEADATDEAVQAFLVDIVQTAAAAVREQADLAGLACGDPAVSLGLPPSGARATYVAVANAASCVFAVGVDRGVGAPAPGGDSRLGAVLDVELPLTVRFGRAVMPLRQLADLGPGAVVDLGRAPEEPVELLVGERLIARGEVVVVGGNYGVRITQLAGGRDSAVEKEARTS
jgi:flagellar motor switch protein FliN/FliY